MDRRDFIKSLGIAGGMATGLSGTTACVSGLTAGLGAGSASAADHAGAGSARQAMHALLDTIRDIETTMLTPERGFTDPVELAEAERAIAHILYTGLDFWLEGNPERPVFRQYVTPTRKLLGCNPDSIYYFAPIRDDRRYRISGQRRRRDLHVLHDRARQPRRTRRARFDRCDQRRGHEDRQGRELRR